MPEILTISAVRKNFRLLRYEHSIHILLSGYEHSIHILLSRNIRILQFYECFNDFCRIYYCPSNCKIQIFRESHYIFENFSLRASKLYKICSYFKSSNFLDNENGRNTGNFAKIAHKVTMLFQPFSNEWWWSGSGAREAQRPQKPNSI